MRKLVKQKDEAIFQASEANSQKFYGIKHEKDSGFLSKGRDRLGDSIFIPYCVNNLSHGNCWYGKEVSLEDALLDLNNRGFEVCEFDTFLEMAQWLSE